MRADTRLAPGLYRLHWASGGTSLAAVGVSTDGSNWIAPTNWVRPARVRAAGVRNHWVNIDRVEPITGADDPDEWYAREVERMKERAPA